MLHAFVKVYIGIIFAQNKLKLIELRNAKCIHHLRKMYIMHTEYRNPPLDLL